MNKSARILIVTESTGKARTISNIVKINGFTDTTVLATGGALFTIADGGPAYNTGIYPEENFKLDLTVVKEKQFIIQKIQQVASKSESIYICVDSDREGALIGWSIIKFCNLAPEKCFHLNPSELTTEGILSALSSFTKFNENQVYAGLARLMIDKLIGYSLSPFGKKYIGAKSIGRYQSIGLKLITDREKELTEFIPERVLDLTLRFIKSDIPLNAKYIGYGNVTINNLSKADLQVVKKQCEGTSFTIKTITEYTQKKPPEKPFCTATFLQAACSKLQITANEAYQAAKKLYEGIKINGNYTGLITCIRTDSTDLSDNFCLKLQNFVKNTYGTKIKLKPKKPTKRTDNSPEALRIITPEITPEFFASQCGDALLTKVYSLIWRQTLVSVLLPKEETLKKYTITNGKHNFIFEQTSSIDLEYIINNEQAASGDLKINPMPSLNEELQETDLIISNQFTLPPERFTEATLIQELHTKKIGRPGTYVSILNAIERPNRGYVTLTDRRIVPTDLGIQLSNYCNRAFSELVGIKYSKTIEEALDKISVGEIFWLDFIKDFFNRLTQIINDTNELGLVSDIPEKQCPLCNGLMIPRRSRYGRLFYGCSNYPACSSTLSLD